MAMHIFKTVFVFYVKKSAFECTSKVNRFGNDVSIVSIVESCERISLEKDLQDFDRFGIPYQAFSYCKYCPLWTQNAESEFKNVVHMTGVNIGHSLQLENIFKAVFKENKYKIWGIEISILPNCCIISSSFVTNKYPRGKFAAPNLNKDNSAQMSKQFTEWCFFCVSHAKQMFNHALQIGARLVFTNETLLWKAEKWRRWDLTDRSWLSGAPNEPWDFRRKSKGIFWGFSEEKTKDFHSNLKKCNINPNAMSPQYLESIP